MALQESALGIGVAVYAGALYVADGVVRVSTGKAAWRKRSRI
jgi:hypothetical protein